MRPLCASDIRAITTVLRDVSVEMHPLRLPAPSGKGQLCIVQIDTFVPVQIALVATQCDDVFCWQTAAYVRVDVDMELHHLRLPPPTRADQKCVVQIDTVIPVQIELVAPRDMSPRRWQTVSITKECSVS